MINNNKQLRALLVEDSEDDAFFLERHLEACGYSVSALRVETRSEMIKAIDEGIWDVICCDHNLPDFDALRALEVLRESGKDVPFIVVSGAIGELAAVEVMKSGAHDYVPKSSLARLQVVLTREMAEVRNRVAKREAESDLIVANGQLKEALIEVERISSHLVRVERMKALGQMATGIAHDFNNALTKMLGNVEILIDSSTSEDHPLANIKTLILDAAEVVGRLRNFYRPLSESDPSNALDLNDIVRESIELTKPKWKTESEASGAEIKVIAECGEISPVAGQAGEFREALTNLIFNACDAMPEGGTIRITTSSDGGNVLIVVSDTGQGMDEKILERCMEPFFSTKGEMGSGLGLGLVDGMMRRCGGSMGIDSVEGEGTKVILRFRNCEAGTSSDAPGPPNSNDLPHLKVLIAEDDSIVAQITAHFLELDGHTTMVTVDGIAALKEFSEASFDVVICDRAMPRMGGDELVARIKEITPNQPVIMATGLVHSMNEESEDYPRIDYLLAKPVSRISLRSALQKVVNERGAKNSSEELAIAQ